CNELNRPVAHGGVRAAWVTAAEWPVLAKVGDVGRVESAERAWSRPEPRAEGGIRLDDLGGLTQAVADRRIRRRAVVAIRAGLRLPFRDRQLRRVQSDSAVRDVIRIPGRTGRDVGYLRRTNRRSEPVVRQFDVAGRVPRAGRIEMGEEFRQ